MCTSFRFQCGFQFCDTRFEYCRRVVVAPAIEDNHRNSAILHEAVTRAHLVGTLLRRLAGWTLQTQSTSHSIFSGLRVAG